MWNGGMIRRSDEGKDWCKFILDSFVSLFIQSFSCQPRKIPASECWLLTDRHYLDSIERGPIPCFNQPNNNNNQSGRRNEICHSAFVCFPTTIYSWHIACYFTCEICLQLQKVSFQNHNELETLITMLHYYTLYETAWLTRYVSPLVRAMVNLPSSLSSSPEHLVRAQGALRPVETVPLNGREFPSNKKRGACCPCPVVLWGLAQQYLVRMRNDRAHRRSLQKKVRVQNVRRPDGSLRVFGKVCGMGTSSICPDHDWERNLCRPFGFVHFDVSSSLVLLRIKTINTVRLSWLGDGTTAAAIQKLLFQLLVCDNNKSGEAPYSQQSVRRTEEGNPLFVRCETSQIFFFPWSGILTIISPQPKHCIRTLWLDIPKNHIKRNTHKETESSCLSAVHFRSHPRSW